MSKRRTNHAKGGRPPKRRTVVVHGPRKVSKIFEEYGPFSEARISALGSPISIWTTHEGPSVHGPNTLFYKPPL